MQLTAEGVSILKQVKQRILEEPLRLNMAAWFVKKETTSVNWDSYSSCRTEDFPPCGTAACIAGWTILIKTGKFETLIHEGEEAAKILSGEPYNYRDLFFVGDWDQPFRREYVSSETPEDKASIAARYINHYILTRGPKEI